MNSYQEILDRIFWKLYTERLIETKRDDLEQNEIDELYGKAVKLALAEVA